ncbi:hypothetical protein [Micromonospora sp. RV43]|uniref:hypothetical protein n=1 Tax=Micromonospora sp. RV43 TaxID=1661387 RepID=UPI00128DCEAD|nr:hypothetical protein [Micromonospora sp. RV43]
MDVDWAAFDKLMTTDPTTYFHLHSLASVRAFAQSLIAVHQPLIDEALDHAKGTAGLEDENLTLFATAFFAINVDQAEAERAAMAEARPLIEKLLAAGVFHRLDSDGEPGSP